jgi:hypothetical protein
MMVLSFCTTTKNAAGKIQTVSYEADVAPILQERCTPCHFPDGGKRRFLDTHQAVKENIDSILYRVQLQPDQKGFMPFKSKKPPLSDSLINVLKTWRNQDFPS